MRTLACGKPTQVTNAAPCAWRQKRQWQWAQKSEGAVAAKRNAPHMHRPVNSSIDASIASRPSLGALKSSPDRALFEEFGAFGAAEPEQVAQDVIVVLADFRRDAADRPWRRTKPYRHARDASRAAVGKLDRREESTRRKLRIGGQVRAVEHDARGHACLLQQHHRGFGLLRRGPSRDLGVERLAIAHPQVERAEPGIDGPLRIAERVREALPLGLRAHGDREPAIVVTVARTTAVDAVGRGRPLLRAPSGRLLLAAVDGDIQQRRSGQARERLELRKIDELAAARALAMP